MEKQRAEIPMNYEVRINKIIGQLKALALTASKENTSCDKVLQQISAVEGGVKSLKRCIIDESLEACAEASQPHKETKQLLTSIRRYL